MQPLVQRSPPAAVIYTGLLLIVAGLALALGSRLSHEHGSDIPMVW